MRYQKLQEYALRPRKRAIRAVWRVSSARIRRRSNAEIGGIVGTTIDVISRRTTQHWNIGDGDEFYYETQRAEDKISRKQGNVIEKDGYSYDNISASAWTRTRAFRRRTPERWQNLYCNA